MERGGAVRLVLAAALSAAVGACAKSGSESLNPRDGGSEGANGDPDPGDRADASTFAADAPGAPDVETGRTGDASPFDAGMTTYDPEAVARRLAEAECTRLERCNPVGFEAGYFSDRAECVRSGTALARGPYYFGSGPWPLPLLAGGTDLIGGAVSAGSIVFDADRFESCLAKAALPCDEYWSRWDCEPYLRATRGEGDQCFFDGECTSGLWCRKGRVRECGVCTRSIEPGQPCPHAWSCVEAAHCWPRAPSEEPICLPLLDSGAACRDESGAAIGECPDSESCRGISQAVGHCVPNARAGERCSDEEMSEIPGCGNIPPPGEPLLRCEPPFAREQRCVPWLFAAPGEPCGTGPDVITDCRGTYVCSAETNGTCIRPAFVPAGTPCFPYARWFERCEPGTVCDIHLGTCTMRSDEGGDCRWSRYNCAEGLSCIGGTCTRIAYEVCE